MLAQKSSMGGAHHQRFQTNSDEHGDSDEYEDGEEGAHNDELDEDDYDDSSDNNNITTNSNTSNVNNEASLMDYIKKQVDKKYDAFQQLNDSNSISGHEFYGMSKQEANQKFQQLLLQQLN